MVGGFDQIAAGLIRLGPEDTAVGNGQVFGRLSAVDSHVAHILVTEVARVAGRVAFVIHVCFALLFRVCLLYTSPSPRDQRGSRMPSSA